MNRINNNIEKLTSDILINNDIYKIPADILKLAEINDIKVYKGDLGKGVLGAIKYDRIKDKFIILINENDLPHRQRFTLAHELGHFFLNREELQSDELHIDIMYRTPNEREDIIDYFAGALLMNKNFIEKIYKLNPSISELAKTFQVSESVATVRLDVLGLI